MLWLIHIVIRFTIQSQNGLFQLSFDCRLDKFRYLSSISLLSFVVTH